MNKKLKLITQCAVFAAILCICSPLAVSIGPVPISLGIFAVMLAGVVLSPIQAVLSVLVYLLLGLLLPIFSGGQSGITALPGPTGGYIWSYILTAAVISLFCKIKCSGYFKNVLIALAGCVTGTAICYICGSIQYALINQTTFAKVLPVCVFPFILPDLAKAACASFLGVEIKRKLR